MDISKKIPTLSPFRISGGRVGGGRRLDFQCGTALTLEASFFYCTRYITDTVPFVIIKW